MGKFYQTSGGPKKGKRQNHLSLSTQGRENFRDLACRLCRAYPSLYLWLENEGKVQVHMVGSNSQLQPNTENSLSLELRHE